MDGLNQRIQRIESLVDTENLPQKIHDVNERIRRAFSQLPELQKLYDIQKSIPSTSDTSQFNIELVLQNYEKYKDFVANAIEINAIDISKLRVRPAEVSGILNNQAQLLQLCDKYMYNLVRSLVLVEKYVQCVVAQNRFYTDVHETLAEVNRFLHQYHQTHY
ncbi:hypothetical protein PSN45_000333 [Yamadazyma tenuis]|uniref:uncharacterized protein n=1 Tax=Candida tenuis TaxID=2315449 RepID=UPI0027A4FAB1|nr:hypothetical protein PSN45_000333 [Yamadazyma tenuis]